MKLLDAAAQSLVMRGGLRAGSLRNLVWEQEATMTKENKIPENMDEAAEQSIDQARGAMENYVDFFQKRMFASPWANTELTKKIQSYAGKNIATTFEFAQQLGKAKNLHVQIQKEFMETQLKALSEQMKDLGETATKAATDAFKNS
jgi:hypothetical protein